MDFDGIIMGVSGARGVVGDALTPEAACRLAAAFGSDRPGRILVARDSRPSGVLLAQAACAGLSSVGCTPVLSGTCTTPGAQVAVETLTLAGGVMITASHNPAPWNGLKFIAADGAFLTAEQAVALYDRAKADPLPRRGWEGWPAPTMAPDVGLVHARRVVRSSLVDVKAIRRRGFRMVVDCNHGASGPLVRTIGSLLDLRLTILGEEPTGFFLHTPEPIPEHLGELERVVRASEADMGAAIDPDGDRLTLCSPHGLLPEEATLALVAAAVLPEAGGPAVTNLSTSRMLDDVAGALGVLVIRSPVGEAHVVAAMKASGASLGGEGNGGVILPGIHHGRDAAAGLAVLLTHLAVRGLSLEQVWAEIPRYTMIKRKVHADAASWGVLGDKLPALFSDFTLDTRDGFKLIWPDRWLHVRRSNTEPVVRIIAEGRDKGDVMMMIDSVARTLTGGGG